MGKLNARKVAALAKDEPRKTADGNGLYFVVPTSGEPFWILRFSINGSRPEMTLGSYPELSLADARDAAFQQRKLIQQGINPLAERQRRQWSGIQTVDDLFEDWFEHDLKDRLKHPNIPKRVYTKEIRPVIGKLKIDQVTALDVREVIRRIVDSNRPTIANDTLMYMKQLFRHANKLDLTQINPAAAFRVNDAGGVEESRARVLTEEEIETVFRVFRENNVSFTRENYLACCLYLVLGVRNSELCQAPWTEFDLESAIWEIPKERTKNGISLLIPLPRQAVEWLQELKIRAIDSDYVFPSRRRSKNPYMGADTITTAIKYLFGQDKARPTKNKMEDVDYFVVHDLRRTFRTLASAEGVDGQVAERCLNHKLKGVEGIYNRHDFLEERREAHQKVADRICHLL
ncbi:tyrosine-type recombinase/integrase [Vibrio parahaemolyticus]|uniref:tyrosine-type recombinase/integrase n=1 Tax=Vibrio parahaemolyticus TaxID=670 RepID=UPI00111E7729|nr:site-specific integrase [Vibrio parahaemolyticus]MBE3843624.1 tyrosine-type recombinase/integrase [Vibrio parahaemolyticus]MBE3943705.1 tyrosine-type recombinase/integrase [Vibrio parahaemolyticus]MBE4119368.1 tyrosine-type recombinase/integrase [Vibrio parahaemolyticus]MBE4127967.1 tyrosine-type recombinase/integrase [Vibrio parahaemolyticus]MBE4780456.1 tyrosine-type recombinase/integrase [Vibrio parahaemolyticus]